MKYRSVLVGTFIGACWLSGCYDLALSVRSDAGIVAGGDTDTGEEDKIATENADNPCYNLRCASPPYRTCAGADGISVPNDEGYCVVDGDKPKCEYPYATEQCLDGECIDGNCVMIPCQGVRCIEPDPPVCEGDKLIITQPGGFCSADGLQASCSYVTRKIDCSDGCKDGVCNKEICKGIACNEPPSRFCANNGNLIVWNRWGRCNIDDGKCVYTAKEILCDSGCANGRCKGDDPCAWTSCFRPPANYCEGIKDLKYFENVGWCEKGACRYKEEISICNANCDKGHCEDDLCLGVYCTAPPAPSCDGLDELSIWDGNAWGEKELCQDGVCEYEYGGNVDCGDLGCKNGKCINDPCAGLQYYCDGLAPLADHCAGDNAITFSTGGTCEGNSFCGYARTEKACDVECTGGECSE